MNIEFVLSVMLLAATAGVVFSRNLVNAVIASSVFSMFLTLKYFTLNAPDVAITEAALGAGLSTLVFLVALYKTKETNLVISLLDHIPTDTMIPIRERKHDAILRMLLDHSLREYSLQTRAEALDKLLEAGSGQEVNLGRGFALSHTRLDSVRDIHIAIGLLTEPVRAFRGEPVSTVFCIVLPNEKSRTYLSLMARLTRFLGTDAAVSAFSSGDGEVIEAAIRQFEAN
jgi:energy-converting hydrogenase B subunit D